MSGKREQASSIGAIRACAGHKLRSWRSWLSLTVVVGLAGGAVLACVAGGRRTDSAYARFARSHLAADMIVYPSFASAPGTSNFDRVARLPQVKVAAMLEGYNTDGPIAASPGAAYGQTVNVPKLLSGRLPRPDQADEVAVTYAFARDRHLAVGRGLDVRFLGSPPMPGSAPSVLPVTVRVVGIEVSPGDFPPALQATFSVQMVLTPAFLSTYGPRLGPPIPVLMVRFVHGDADSAAFETGLRGLTSGQPQSHARLALQADNVQRGIHLQALALWLLAGFLAIAVTLVLYHLLARQSMLAAEDNRTLRALGLTRTQLWLSTIAPPVVVGLTGAAMALAVAVAVSPLLPAGTARTAEPHPGLAADWFAVGLGALSVAAVVIAIALRPAWRAASQAGDIERDSGRGKLTLGELSERVTGVGASPAASVGIRMALDPGAGRSAVPVRSSLAGVTLAVVALTAALTFGSSLTHLLATPRLYGWNWDVHVSSKSNNRTRAASLDTFAPTLGSDPRIEAVAFLESPPLLVGDLPVTGVILRSVKGNVAPVVLKGRAPESGDEVALGAKTMQDLHAHLGGIVPVSISVTQLVRAPKRVVGVVVIPPENDAARFGLGAMLTSDGEQSLIPPGVQVPPRSEAVLRLAARVDHNVVLADVRRQLGVQWAVAGPSPPTDLVNFGHVQNLPLVLTGLLALLAIATLAHTIITSVSRRGRELSVLKTLGFVRAQIRHVVAWQATTMAAVAVVVGLPLGLAAGRLLWDAFANQLGTRPEPVTPLTVLVLLPAALLAANLAAAPSAFLAARTPPAVLLRSE